MLIQNQASALTRCCSCAARVGLHTRSIPPEPCRGLMAVKAVQLQKPLRIALGDEGAAPCTGGIRDLTPPQNASYRT